MEITYTTCDCRLGRLLIASSPKGLCMIAIGKSDRELEQRLHDQFPATAATRNDLAMSDSRRFVEDRIEGRALKQNVALHLHGTPFQVAVWKEMLRIPAGSTRSYGDLARKIGKPKAFRAVAQACGANPIPIVVPCHRVIAAGGALGGYTGGLDRKLALLASEGVSDPNWKSA